MIILNARIRLFSLFFFAAICLFVSKTIYSNDFDDVVDELIDSMVEDYMHQPIGEFDVSNMAHTMLGDIIPIVPIELSQLVPLPGFSRIGIQGTPGYIGSVIDLLSEASGLNLRLGHGGPPVIVAHYPEAQRLLNQINSGGVRLTASHQGSFNTVLRYSTYFQEGQISNSVDPDVDSVRPRTYFRNYMTYIIDFHPESAVDVLGGGLLMTPVISLLHELTHVWRGQYGQAIQVDRHFHNAIEAVSARNANAANRINDVISSLFTALEEMETVGLLPHEGFGVAPLGWITENRLRRERRMPLRLNYSGVEFASFEASLHAQLPQLVRLLRMEGYNADLFYRGLIQGLPRLSARR